MRVIVTGGAGFIGSAVCRHLVGIRDQTVLNIDKLTYAADLRSLEPVADSPRYRFERFDIRDRAALDTVFQDFRPDAVVNLAADSHVDRSIRDAAPFVGTNIVGTYALLEAARDYVGSAPSQEAETFRFLHVSTDEVYGDLEDGACFGEDTPYNPSSPYAASKAAADHLVLAWGRTYGLPVLISNCANNYGPYQFPEKLIPLMIINGIERRPLPVYGDGLNVRDWLHVDDHVHAIVQLLAAGRPGEKYNVGARNERRNLEIVGIICDVLDEALPAGAPHERLVRFVADRPGHDRRYAIDPSKIEAELGWRSQVDFETGLAETVHWYVRNRAWWEPHGPRGRKVATGPVSERTIS